MHLLPVSSMYDNQLIEDLHAKEETRTVLKATASVL